MLSHVSSLTEIPLKIYISCNAIGRMRWKGWHEKNEAWMHSKHLKLGLAILCVYFSFHTKSVTRQNYNSISDLCFFFERQIKQMHNKKSVTGKINTSHQILRKETTIHFHGDKKTLNAWEGRELMLCLVIWSHQPQP